EPRPPYAGVFEVAHADDDMVDAGDPVPHRILKAVSRIDLTTEPVRHGEESSSRRRPGSTCQVLEWRISGSRPSPGRRLTDGEDRVFLAAGAHLAFGEDAVRRDPREAFLVHLLRVGFENEAFARAPAPRVHHVAEARRKFLAVIMRVAVGPQIDVALCPAQCAEIFPHIL